MSIDFQRINKLYRCAERIAGANDYPALRKAVSLHKKLLEKDWDIDNLKATYKKSVEGAKLKVLSDPVFLSLIKVHSGNAESGAPRTNRYCEAFDKITGEKIEVEYLKKEFGLKDFAFIQHARFDPFPERGKIYTKKIDGKKMIWRER